MDHLFNFHISKLWHHRKKAPTLELKKEEDKEEKGQQVPSLKLEVSHDLQELGKWKHQGSYIHHENGYEPNAQTFYSRNPNSYLLQEINNKGEGINQINP